MGVKDSFFDALVSIKKAHLKRLKWYNLLNMGIRLTQVNTISCVTLLLVFVLALDQRLQLVA